MFIEKINAFLPRYKNLTRDTFLSILRISNTRGFLELKLEKDFLLTLILIKFGEKYPDLIFKGGTCLNKVYFPYFRLSEDLDFILDKDIGRSSRKNILKQYENNLKDDLQILGLSLREERTKFDEHKLAMFTFEYESVLDGSLKTIKIDISLKNPLKLPKVSGNIQSLFVDELLEEKVFGNHSIGCIDLRESLAEKMRAALTRSIPAIRDFFDIWYVRQNSDFNFVDPIFLELVDTKLYEVGYKYTLEENFEYLQKQIHTDLKPVLNEEYSFDFENIYNFVLSFKK